MIDTAPMRVLIINDWNRYLTMQIATRLRAGEL